MLALLIKDLLALKSSLRIMLAFVVLMAVVTLSNDSSAYNVMGFYIVFVSMLPFTALALDERSKWMRYALTTPLSRAQLVLSKYLLCLLLVLFMAGVTLLITVFAAGALTQEVLEPLVVYMSTSIMLNALSMPVMFRFGTEKARIVMMLLAAAIVGGTMMLNVPGLLDGISIPISAFLLAALMLLLLSVLLSLHIYKKKSFA